MDAVDRSEGLLKNAADPYVSAGEAGAGRYSQRFLTGIDHALKFREEERPQSVDEWLANLDVPVDAALAAPAMAIATGTGAGAAARDASEAPTEARSGVGPAPPTIPLETQAHDDLQAYRTFIGPNRTHYYLSRFERFELRGFLRRVSWHWQTALLTFPWMLYRRLYLWALVLHPAITLVLTFLCLIPIAAASEGDVPKPLLVAVMGLVSILWPGLYANAVYHRRARARLGQLQSLELGPEAQLEWLARRGGTSRRALVLGILAILVFWLLVVSDRIKQARQANQAALTGDAPLSDRPASDSLPSDAAATDIPEADAGAVDEATSDAPEADTVSIDEPLTDIAGPAGPDEPVAEIDATAAHIDALLDGASDDYEGLRLTTPAAHNAFDKLQEVLALDPGNADAKQGVERIAAKYVELGNSALRHDELQKAIGLYRRSLEVVPHNAAANRGLDHALERIKQLGVTEAERGNVAAAERYLNWALELAPNSPELRRYKKRLKLMKAKKRKPKKD